jgi:quercetin dioxygenase-like cupin family protein
MSANQNNSTAIDGVTQQADLIQYQTGSVVSRMLVKQPGGNVTAFAFDEGEGLSEHTAPFDALVFMIEGDAEVSIAKNVHRVRAGEMLLLPAGQPHALKAITRFKMILVMIKA